MKPGTTALILCGGKGERLRPLTDSTPKPLIHIKGRPILSYLLDHLRRFDVTEIVVAAGFHADKIGQFVRENGRGLNISIVDSGDVDIIERIKDCAPRLKKDFLVLYGDTLADLNLDDFQEFHLAHGAKATITLWPLKSQFGIVELDGKGNVTRFREKPTLDHWVNIGNFYYDNEVISWMREFTSYADFLASLASRNQLMGYKHRGIHITVNTLRELEEAEYNIDQLAVAPRPLAK
jgi:NDP-sugar pyrophosphorylase family protein